MYETRRNTPHTRGFTLIELLVVVGIVGILAAIAIPQFGVYRQRGFRARIESDARNAATAEEAYYVDMSSYLEGDCSLLPGFDLSPGVLCSATVSSDPVLGSIFQIQTSHPASPRRCTWSSNSSPNLICS